MTKHESLKIINTTTAEGVKEAEAYEEYLNMNFNHVEVQEHSSDCLALWGFD
jgi:hypothetical protein